MRELQNPFVTKSFLRSVWALDYEAYKDSEDEKALLLRLKNWAKRADLKETSAESALLDEFFKIGWKGLPFKSEAIEENFSFGVEISSLMGESSQGA